MNLIEELEAEQIARLDKEIPSFRAGDTIRVGVRVTEGQRKRVQHFEGVCIARKNGDSIAGSFTVRKISYGEGVERVFPLYSTVIEEIQVVRRGRVRRAKLYYLRSRRGKKARIPEDIRGKLRVNSSGAQTQEVSFAIKGPDPQYVDRDFSKTATHGKLNEIMRQVDSLRTARDEGSMLSAFETLSEVQRALPSKLELAEEPGRFFEQFMEIAAHAVPLSVFGHKPANEEATLLCKKMGRMLADEFNTGGLYDPLDLLVRHLGVSFVVRFDSQISKSEFSCMMRLSDLRKELGIENNISLETANAQKLRVSLRRENSEKLETIDLVGPLEYPLAQEEETKSFSEKLDHTELCSSAYILKINGKIAKRVLPSSAEDQNALRLIL